MERKCKRKSRFGYIEIKKNTYTQNKSLYARKNGRSGYYIVKKNTYTQNKSLYVQKIESVWVLFDKRFICTQVFGEEADSRIQTYFRL